MKKKKNIFVRILLWTAGLIVLGYVSFLGLVTWVHYSRDSVEIYKQTQFDKPTRPFIKHSLAEIPVAKEGQTALILEAAIVQLDAANLLQKKYNLITVDNSSIPVEVIVPGADKHKDKIKDIRYIMRPDFNLFPELDVVMANFYVSFYDAKFSAYIWNSIKDKLNPGGFIIANFFDPATDIFHDKDPKNMTYHTKEDVLALLSDFEVLKFEEVKEMTKAGLEHRYDVFARKRQ